MSGTYVRCLALSLSNNHSKEVLMRTSFRNRDFFFFTRELSNRSDDQKGEHLSMDGICSALCSRLG